MAPSRATRKTVSIDLAPGPNELPALVEFRAAAAKDASNWNHLLRWHRRSRGPQWDYSTAMYHVDQGSKEYFGGVDAAEDESKDDDSSSSSDSDGERPEKRQRRQGSNAGEATALNADDLATKDGAAEGAAAAQVKSDGQKGTGEGMDEDVKGEEGSQRSGNEEEDKENETRGQKNKADSEAGAATQGKGANSPAKDGSAPATGTGAASASPQHRTIRLNLSSASQYGSQSDSNKQSSSSASAPTASQSSATAGATTASSREAPTSEARQKNEQVGQQGSRLNVLQQQQSPSTSTHSLPSFSGLSSPTSVHTTSASSFPSMPSGMRFPGQTTAPLQVSPQEIFKPGASQ